MPPSSAPRLDESDDAPPPDGLPVDPADTFAPENRLAPGEGGPLDSSSAPSLSAAPGGWRRAAPATGAPSSADVLSRWSLFGEDGLSLGPRRGGSGEPSSEEAAPESESSPPGESTTRPGSAGDASVAPPDGPQYRLDRLVGEGGMGEVWEAWQESLGRVVAVKRIRPRLLARPDLSASDRARATWDFRQEAAITAHLEHPNIVPVHDLGADAKGNPLLAMKLVKGRSWEKIARDEFKALPAEEFLAKHLPILADVAQAVAFAHARGVVHRDLKPGQVMVGEFGETLLMDWGLAIVYKTLDDAETDDPSRPSIQNSFGFPSLDSASNPAGTPALMAPEQTTRSAREIGPWTDVYLLGGTLYYLLTGGYPHRAKTSGEAMRKARAGVVEAPSLRAPDREMPAQLEALCVKALAKEPSDRVDGAKEFVAALEDYLTGATRRRECDVLAAGVERKLEAGASLSYGALTECLSQLARARSLWPGSPKLPPLADRALELHARAALASGDLALARAQAARVESTSIRDGLLADVERAEARARALARQRRALLAGVVALLAIVAAGLAIFLWVVGRKNSALDVANSELGRAVATLDRRNAQLEEERRRAEARGTLAMSRAAESQESLQFMLGGLQAELDLTEPRDRRLRDAAVAQALRSLRERDLSNDTPDSLALHADGLARIALALVNLAMPEEAEEAAGRAMRHAAEAEKRGAPKLASPAMAVGAARMARGDFDGAEEALREALAIATEDAEGAGDKTLIEASFLLADALRATGRVNEAEGPLRAALEAAERRVAADPSLEDLHYPDAMNNLASIYRSQYRIDEAEELFRKALAEVERLRGPDHPDVAPYVNNLALLLSRERHALAEAEPLMRRALAIAEAAWGVDHPNVARCLTNLAGLLVEADRTAEAMPMSRRALQIHEAAHGPGHPSVTLALNNLARLTRMAGDLEEAERLLGRCIASFEAGGRQPIQGYAIALNNYCELLTVAGKLEEALVQGEKAVEAGTRAFQSADPRLASCRVNMAMALERLGRPEEALPLVLLGLEAYHAAYGPDNAGTRSIAGAKARLEAAIEAKAGGAPPGVEP